MKNKKKVVGLLTVTVLLVTIFAAGYTFARYYKKMDAKAGATIARWSFGSKNEDKVVKLSEEKREIYNRYAHVMFEITDKESDVELIHADNVSIKLNYKELSKLNIEYILSTVDLNEMGFETEFEELYRNDGDIENEADNIYIFKVMEGIE